MKKLPVLLGLLMLIVSTSLTACTTQTQVNSNQNTPDTSPTPQEVKSSSSSVISRDVPAFAYFSYSPASRANDSSYDTAWRSVGTPTWLAYDLSNAPASQRARVLVVWYNETNDYDHTLIKYPAYNIPENYTIDVNAAPGGGRPPTSGWKTLVTVMGNHYHSRQHIVNMAGNNWIRINVTKVDGVIENYDVKINMDVYGASSSTADDWIFYGDSITAGGMGHLTINRVRSFAQLISAQSPNNFPAQESGGTGYLTSDEGAKYISTWLSLFPGRFVGLDFGTNDALGCASGANFYSNYVTMVKAVLSAGKIPVVPLIPWGKAGSIQQCGPALNTQIEALYKAFPQVMKGPDLWSFFQSHQNLISDDNIHPTVEGFSAYRQQWANAMLAEVYLKS